MIESSKPIASLQNFGIRKMDKKKMRRKHLSELMGSLKSYVCLVGNKDININIPLSSETRAWLVFKRRRFLRIYEISEKMEVSSHSQDSFM